MSDCEIHHGDCLEVLPQLPAESVHLVFADPPYNIGKAAWDKIEDYFGWCEKWIAECSRVLKRNGAFWISHSKPLVLAKLSEMVAKHGRGLVNWVTWDKYYGKNFFYVPQRSFEPMAEHLIFHADEGDWMRQCDKERGFIFEPLRAYLDGERKRAGVSPRACNVACQNQMAGHYFTYSQWALPTEENYLKLRQAFNTNGTQYLRREYEDLRREYEDLRREYEDLRYTFNNPGKVSSVWQIPPAKKNGHPTPKPEALLERVIKATSNEGDVVLDPFLGSGTTIAVARRLNRQSIGIETEEKYCEMSRDRMAQLQLCASGAA